MIAIIVLGAVSGLVAFLVGHKLLDRERVRQRKQSVKTREESRALEASGYVFDWRAKIDDPAFMVPTITRKKLLAQINAATSSKITMYGGYRDEQLLLLKARSQTYDTMVKQLTPPVVRADH